MAPIHRTASRLSLVAVLGFVSVEPLAPLPALARLVPERLVAPRLSVGSAHRTCRDGLPDDGAMLRGACPGRGAPPREVGNVARRALARATATGDPEALRTVALIDLLWPNDTATSLRKAVSSLRSAAGLARRPAPVLADLSGALLLRAEYTRNTRDLLDAVEAAAKALEAESTNVAARFNRALALERLALAGEAEKAWRAYLAVDSTSPWAAEARRRGAALVAPATPPRPGPGAPRARVAEYAAREPQNARLWGWDTVLGEWGDAVLRGDAATAAARLRLAAALGEALEAQCRDATLADAVRAIRARAADPAATRALAAAHRAYAAGRAAFNERRYDAAGAPFAQALEIRPPSAPLQLWARHAHAVMRVYEGEYAAAAEAAAGVIARADPVRHPALAASARSVLGSALYRGSQRYEQARDTLFAAARLFARAGEREMEGSVTAFAADAEFLLGTSDAAYATMQRALVLLRPYRASVWLHNLLSIAPEEAVADGWRRAAAHLQDEDIAVAGRNDPQYLAEALGWRAQLRTLAGDLPGARADLREAQALADGLSPDVDQEWLRADLRLARAGLLLRSDPARATVVFDSILTTGDTTGAAPRILQARVGRAQARLALGDARGAGDDLDRATALLREQHDAITSAPLRASLLDAARGIFDQLVMLRVADVRPAEALAYLERGRASFSRAAPGAPGPARARVRGPRGSVVVEYALIGDTLLAWTVADTTVRLHRRTVNRADFARATQRVRSALELRAGEAAVRADLAALYDALVRPVRDDLGGAETPLVVIADGEIAGVPFAALYDADRRRYLVQDHPLRFANSLHDAARPAPRAKIPAAALFVADPAFEPRAHPGLAPLPEAAAEIRAAAGLYPRPTVLTGRDAHGDALLAAVRNASLVHFGGHAVFDNERPERSYLVLAPAPGGGGSGRLSAEEAATADLRHVRLVVLSACETLPSRSGRAGGFAGFAGALLGAGAGGVAGSLWRVDDALTRALMTEFHDAYSRSGDGPGALREAQLRLLRSDYPALRSPAAWAGFRYAGH